MDYRSFFPNKLVFSSRLLLGLLFLVFGLNGFLHFLPQPEVSESAAQFMGALVQSGYMIPLVFAVQLTVGILLLLGRFVPLALILITPITVNIIGFHLAMDLKSIGPGILVAILQIYLLFAYLPSYKSLLEMKARPVPLQQPNQNEQ